MNDEDVIAAFRVLRAMLRDQYGEGYTAVEIARTWHVGEPGVTIEDVEALARVEAAIDGQEAE